MGKFKYRREKDAGRCRLERYQAAQSDGMKPPNTDEIMPLNTTGPATPEAARRTASRRTNEKGPNRPQCTRKTKNHPKSRGESRISKKSGNMPNPHGV